MNKIEYYKFDSDTSTPSFLKMDYEKRHDSNFDTDCGFMFAIYEDRKINILSGQLNPRVKDVYSILHQNEIKEKLYLKAVKNLIKKNEYLQLTMQFDQDLISDDEFYHELDSNEDKYLIKIDYSFDESQFEFINQIIHKLNSDFSSDEIAELFSVPIETVNVYIDKHLKQQDK